MNGTASFVLAETRGAVRVLTLNRPEARNALSDGLVAELAMRLSECERDPAVRAIVLAGGPKAFAAGADIQGMAKASASDMASRDPLAVWDRVAEVSKPVIAAVNGWALGGGCELALACDLIIAGEDAVFGQPEILLGVIPGAGGTQRLTRTVGKVRTLELLLTARRLGAAQALDWGIVNAVVAPEKTLEEALRVAAQIAAQPPVAVREIKACVKASLETGLSQGLREERRRFYALFDTQDQKEGMAAFLEKRPARFVGK